MGVKRVFKKFLKYLIPTLLVLLIIPVTGRKYQSSRSMDSFRGKPLRCALRLGQFDNLKKGYLTGFNYERLKIFGSAHSDSTVIFLGENDVSYLDSLILDSLDILVVPSREFSRHDGLIVLNPTDTSVAWVIRKDPYRGHEILRWFKALKAYDDFIKKNAKVIGWDWRLLASLIWNESMFRIQAKSPRGAVGLMQMMPRTAKSFGLENMLDPEESIAAGARYLLMLEKTFSSYSTDPEVVTRLAIASYNCGQGRTMEDLEGREQSAETVAYTKAVLNLYDYFRGVEPRYKEVADSVALLSPDSLGGIDPGDEHAGDEEKKHDDQE